MKIITRALLAIFALLPIACTAASDETYKEGTHYKLVREITAPLDPKRIEVNEFFWYGCPHCFHLEPELEKWLKLKPADVDFSRVPNSLGRPIGLLHSKSFYTADTLNVLDKIHLPLFSAIHNERQQMASDAEVAAFFNAKTGILPDVVIGTLNGFAVDSRVRRAEALAKQFGIASTPTIVVDGRWQTDVTKAGGNTQVLKVVDFLIAKARKERKK